jgi:hypothetical protein
VFLVVHFLNSSTENPGHISRFIEATDALPLPSGEINPAGE